MTQPLPNSYWVLPKRLLAGEHPWGDNEADTKERLERLREAGINYFIDLTEAGETPDYRPLLPAQSHYLRCAIRDMEVPQEVAHMQELLMRIRTALTLEPAHLYSLPRGHRPHRHGRRLLSGGGRTWTENRRSPV